MDYHCEAVLAGVFRPSSKETQEMWAGSGALSKTLNVMLWGPVRKASITQHSREQTS